MSLEEALHERFSAFINDLRPIARPPVRVDDGEPVFFTVVLLMRDGDRQPKGLKIKLYYDGPEHPNIHIVSKHIDERVEWFGGTGFVKELLLGSNGDYDDVRHDPVIQRVHSLLLKTTRRPSMRDAIDYGQRIIRLTSERGSKLTNSGDISTATDCLSVTSEGIRRQ